MTITHLNAGRVRFAGRWRHSSTSKGAFMRLPFASHAETDGSSGRLQRQLQGASDAAMLGHKLRMLNIEAAHRLAWHRSHFNPDQLRVPAGHPDGGQWTRDGR